jgi:hypothetical protein
MLLRRAVTQMIVIEHRYKGYEIHIFVRQFINTDEWTFNASVFGHAGDPEIVKRLHYSGRLASKEVPKAKPLRLCENGSPIACQRQRL